MRQALPPASRPVGFVLLSHEPSHVLSIDLGTSGPKVALVSEAGTLAAATSRRIETLCLGPDAFEQDAEAIWRAVCEGIREVVDTSGVPTSRIVGIGLVAQFFSLVPVDEKARPLSNLLLWRDGRGAPYARELLGKQGAPLTWIEHHGMIPLPSGADSLSKMLWVDRERPEVHALGIDHRPGTVGIELARNKRRQLCLAGVDSAREEQSAELRIAESIRELLR